MFFVTSHNHNAKRLILYGDLRPGLFAFDKMKAVVERRRERQRFDREF